MRKTTRQSKWQWVVCLVGVVGGGKQCIVSLHITSSDIFLKQIFFSCLLMLSPFSYHDPLKNLWLSVRHIHLTEFDLFLKQIFFFLVYLCCPLFLTMIILTIFCYLQDTSTSWWWDIYNPLFQVSKFWSSYRFQWNIANKDFMCVAYKALAFWRYKSKVMLSQFS